jgi:hypothetical protein
MGAPEMAAADEAAMVEALLHGDERAFEGLVQQHHTTLVRLTLRYVRDPAPTSFGGTGIKLINGCSNGYPACGGSS